MNLPKKYFIYPRDILASDLGISRHQLDKYEESGVLRRSDAPAFRHMMVKPFVRHEVVLALGLKEDK